MGPEIFIDNFERTQHSDELHGVIGRALIMATRFDSICESAAMMIELKLGHAGLVTDQEYDELIEKIRYLLTHSETRETIRKNRGVAHLFIHDNGTRWKSPCGQVKHDHLTGSFNDAEKVISARDVQPMLDAFLNVQGLPFFYRIV